MVGSGSESGGSLVGRPIELIPATPTAVEAFGDPTVWARDHFTRLESSQDVVHVQLVFPMDSGSSPPLVGNLWIAEAMETTEAC